MYKKIFLPVFTAFLFTACVNEKKEEAINENTNEVKIVKLFDLSSIRKSKQILKYPAEVFAYQDSKMAFEVQGKIVKFYYKEGEKVKKGSVIAKLDDTIYKANYNSAKANYNQSILDYERYKKLYKTRSIAKVDLEKQKQNMDVMKANYQVAKKNLEETKLIAEFDGIMAKKLVNDFARVTAKEPIVRLQDNSLYKIKFFVPESDIIQSQVKDLSVKTITEVVNFHITLPDDESKIYEASLLDISTTAEKVTRTFEATLQMKPQSGINILPGMTAQVQASLKQSDKKRLFIPYKAVFTNESNNSFVWALNSNNKVSKKQVVLGDVSKDMVEVLSGLENTQNIVTSGVRFLEDNDEVKEYKKIGN